jgi:hypothetical protein
MLKISCDLTTDVARRERAERVERTSPEQGGEALRLLPSTPHPGGTRPRPSRPSRPRKDPTVLHRATTAAASAAAVLLLSLSGCAAADWSAPRPSTTAIGTPAAGFTPEVEPSPEATVEPLADSWAAVQPSPGYRVVLLTSGDDVTTQAISAAVEEWATDTGADLRRVQAGDDAIPGIVEAMDMNPELIVTAGESLIDALAMVTPNHLDIPFLVLGAELAEPTYNVTAVDWTGAGFRGEGLGTATHFDESTFTPERCADAIRAGSTAVLTGMTGVVLWID